MAQNSEIVAANKLARDEILGSVSRNLAASLAKDEVHRRHHGQTAVSEEKLISSVTKEQLIDNFRQSLEAVGGHFIFVTSEDEAADHAATVFSKIGGSRVAISDSPIVKRLTAKLGAEEIVENASAEFLFNCDLGITGAQWVIAETGTLVLESESESHRLTSLVPPVHLCILAAANIRQTLSEILEITSKKLSRTITFITGASRTSDIELTLAIGVHGPAELHVIVIGDQ